MRRLFVGGGIGVAAFLVGWLLFAGGAAAHTLPVTLPFTVDPTSGVFPDTQIGATSPITFTFTWTASESGSLSSFGTALPFGIQTNTCGPTIAYQGTCKVTVDFAPTDLGPTTGGDLTFAYGGSSPGTDEIPLSGTGVAGSTVCHCTKLSAALRDFDVSDHNRVINFSLKWQLDCATGNASRCEGSIHIDYPALRQGLHLWQGNKRWREGELNIACRGRAGAPCQSKINGEHPLGLVSLPHVRAHEVIKFDLRVDCTGLDSTYTGTEQLVLKFDGHGRLDYKDSHFGKLS